MDYASQNMEWFSVTHNTQALPHLTCKHVCLSLLEMHLTEARFASCFVMWKQMQSSTLRPCLSVLSRVCLYKGHICFIKAVRELNRCDSNLLALTSAAFLPTHQALCLPHSQRGAALCDCPLKKQGIIAHFSLLLVWLHLQIKSIHQAVCEGPRPAIWKGLLVISI